MSRREKIIVGFMVVAILYGGYSFLFPDSKSGRPKFSSQKAVAVTDFVTDLVRRIRAADTTVTDTLIIEKATAPWRKDPFQVVSKVAVEDARPEEEAEILDREGLAGSFSYTGYMEMGAASWRLSTGWNTRSGNSSPARAPF